MTPRCWQVTPQGSVVLDGAGAGQIVLGPVPPNRVWTPTFVSCAGQSATGVVGVFLGPAVGAPILAGSGDYVALAFAALVDLYGAGFVTVAITGGLPGATATATLRATASVV